MNLAPISLISTLFYFGHAPKIKVAVDIKLEHVDLILDDFLDINNLSISTVTFDNIALFSPSSFIFFFHSFGVFLKVSEKLYFQ